MMELLLETKGLTKTFKKYHAVNHVDLHIRKGAIYGFIGRNGAGKTTFLKMIAGLSTQTSGEIQLFGYKGKDLAKVRGRIGSLIETPGLYGNMSAFDNLKIKCKLFGIRDEKYINGILETVGLADVGKKKTKQFSLGMKQRLGIGLALVGDPDLLILDEPINGLDPQGIVEVRETIQRLNKEHNMTILISSHILEELSKIATDYGMIHQGILLEEVTKEELMERCRERILIRVDEPKMILPVLDDLGYKNYQVLDDSHVAVYERIEESGELNGSLVKAGILVKEIHVASEELENYFIHLTGGANHA